MTENKLQLTLFIDKYPPNKHLLIIVTLKSTVCDLENTKEKKKKHTTYLDPHSLCLKDWNRFLPWHEIY